MAQLSTRRLYAANQPLLNGDLDAFIDDIETFVNVLQLSDDNIQDDGITASTKIIDGTLTAEEVDNNAITTAKIADSNITTAKINDSAVTTAKIADTNVTTAKIADSAVTTAKLVNSTITGVKLASAAKSFGTINVGPVSGLASSTSTYTDLNSASATITTNGGPVLIIGNGGYYGYSQNGASGIFRGEWVCEFRIYRYPSGSPSSTTDIAYLRTTHNLYASSGSSEVFQVPISTIKHLDEPAAGTWVYVVAARHWSRSFVINASGTTTTGTAPGVLVVSSAADVLVKEML